MNARLKVFVVPIGVVTVTFLALRVAAVVITQFALTVVEVDVIPVQVTFLPKMATAVAPVKLIPARATGTVVPCAPVFAHTEFLCKGSAGIVF